MITRDNIQGIVEGLTPKEKKRIANTSKEYIVIELHCFNVGSYATIKCTNNYNRYKNVYADGNCILESGDTVFNAITGLAR